MMSLRTAGQYINGSFSALSLSFIRIGSVFDLYARFGDLCPEFKTSASRWALFMAKLTPSRELGLIKPAASPIKNAPPPPQQNLSVS